MLAIVGVRQRAPMKEERKYNGLTANVNIGDLVNCVWQTVTVEPLCIGQYIDTSLLLTLL